MSRQLVVLCGSGLGPGASTTTLHSTFVFGDSAMLSLVHFIDGIPWAFSSFEQTLRPLGGRCWNDMASAIVVVIRAWLASGIMLEGMLGRRGALIVVHAAIA